MKKRILPLLAVWLIIGICCVIAVKQGIDTPYINMIGAFASALLITAVTWRFPWSFFLALMVFDIFAAAFGSVLNFYRTIDSYDRIVHFMSGLVAADAGRLIIRHVMGQQADRLRNAVLLFTMFFAFACAGLWEIYEFTADQLLGVDMQGDNLNTMGDIVSGVLGGLLYTIILTIHYKRRPVNNVT